MSIRTPGPWSAHKYPDVKTWTVAATQSIASKIKTAEDARLIAAAPELLDLVRTLLLVTVNAVDPKDFASLRKQCHAVIDKIEGNRE